MSPKQRCAQLVKELSSFAGSAKGFAAEAEVAKAHHERVSALLRKAEGLREALEDPELADLAAQDLGPIEAEVATLDEKTFFKKPRAAGDSLPTLPPSGGYKAEHVCWRLGSLDLEHPKSWLAIEDQRALHALLSKLKTLESATWRQLEETSDHTHDWDDIGDWEKPSRERVEHLQLDDQSGWYQVQLDKRGRLIGFRDGNIMSIVWWDRDHEVYKTKQAKASQK